MEFWQKVKELLEGRPWSWLARQMGISPAALYALRAHSPKYEKIEAVARALNMSVAELMQYVQEPSAERHDPKGPARRRCLHCDRFFWSAHIGNRICAACKASPSYRDVEEEYHGLEEEYHEK